MTLKQVSPGDDFDFPAEAFNVIVAANQYLLQQQQSEMPGKGGNGIKPGIILVHNTSSAKIAAFSPAIITVAIPAVTTLETAVAFRNAQSAFAVATPSASNLTGPVVILQEAIEANAVGKAMIYGVTPAKIAGTGTTFAGPSASAPDKLVTSNSGSAKILHRGADLGVVQLGGSSGGSNDAFPCKITGGSNAAGYTVEIYANGKSAAATGTGTLEINELAMDDNLTAGTWVIGHPRTVTATGGTE